jgi:hypothetical protein
LEAKQLKVGLELLRDRLVTGRDYRFEVRIYPGENAYRIPSTLLAWDLPSTEVEGIVTQNGFGAGQRGRTLNLGVFLKDLRDATYLRKQPPIGILYVYMKAT